jgi:hypothetical protein
MLNDILSFTWAKWWQHPLPHFLQIHSITDTLIIRLVTIYRNVQPLKYVIQLLIIVQLGTTEYSTQINILYVTEKYFTLLVTVVKCWILHPLWLSYWKKRVSTNVYGNNKGLLQSDIKCCTSELKHYHLISSAQSSLGTNEQNNALYEHRNIPVWIPNTDEQHQSAHLCYYTTT